MQENHHAKVTAIRKQIKKYYSTKTPFRVYHGSTNSTRILTFKRSEMIDISSMNKLLSVDSERSVAVMEPNVPMDTLIHETLKYKLVPPVIPEFPGITIGGAIQGGAGESSSFKWGFVSQTVNWIEYILADGSIIKATPTEHADLFYGGAGSSGTIGVITAVEVQLIPAKKYVQVTYLPVVSYQNAVDFMENETKKAHDFVDGIMFGRDHGVIITGLLSDKKQGPIRRFSRAHDPWYYLHAQEIDKAKKIVTETVPLKDYLFRYNRGAFWVGTYAFARFRVPFNAVTRFILNPILNTRKLYQALQDSGASQEHLVQDLTLPLSTSVQFMECIDKLTGIYPLWLCPVKPEPRSPLLCNGLRTPLAINIGVWGPRIVAYATFMKLNTDIEARLAELGGKKWLYAHVYYSMQNFWSIYDKKWYDKLRQKYKATTLPSIYEKVHVRQHFGVNARRGLLKTVSGQAKLRVEE